LYWLFEALKRDPRHAATRRRLAEFYDAKGDHEKAEAHRKFLPADEKQPKSP
jgi:Tfp pilus assembly protein PilF